MLGEGRGTAAALSPLGRSMGDATAHAAPEPIDTAMQCSDKISLSLYLPRFMTVCVCAPVFVAGVAVVVCIYCMSLCVFMCVCVCFFM